MPASAASAAAAGDGSTIADSVHASLCCATVRWARPMYPAPATAIRVRFMSGFPESPDQDALKGKRAQAAAFFASAMLCARIAS
ncbi:hypothetical protein HDG37_003510 [Paraburkholderia sp. MM5384-R2]|nr:hypothetical protein [Paraburkholderia sp. MM5384-R2]